MQTNKGEISDEKTVAPTQKPRDPLFDVGKGVGILFVLGIHSSNNSSRLYTDHLTWQWWVLTIVNRLSGFAVPLFLLISAILSARSLAGGLKIRPFYRRRIVGVLWPYFVWTAVFWGLKMLQDPAARKLETAHFLGLSFTAPALLGHIKARALELVWGKASFHLYFLVVLVQLLIFLPAAVAYIRWRKPGFYEMLATTIVVQAAILVAQHKTGLLPYPASTAFWYIGSLLPSAWIGFNWDAFKANPNRYSPLLLVLALGAGFLFLRGEIGTIHKIPADNYTQNGSLAMYASCMSILAFAACFAIVKFAKPRIALETLGRYSLQIFLIHPAVIVLLEKHAVVRVLNPTYFGPILSPILMLAITFGIIWAIKLLRLEKPLFGR